eukprot:gene3333-7311_t
MAVHMATSAVHLMEKAFCHGIDNAPRKPTDVLMTELCLDGSGHNPHQLAKAITSMRKDGAQ